MGDKTKWLHEYTILKYGPFVITFCNDLGILTCPVDNLTGLAWQFMISSYHERCHSLSGASHNDYGCVKGNAATGRPGRGCMHYSLANRCAGGENTLQSATGSCDRRELNWGHIYETH